MSWAFPTEHAYALPGIARYPGVRPRDLALMVGVTERATQRIVNDLVAAGYVSRACGSRTVYIVVPTGTLGARSGAAAGAPACWRCSTMGPKAGEQRRLMTRLIPECLRRRGPPPDTQRRDAVTHQGTCSASAWRSIGRPTVASVAARRCSDRRTHARGR